MIGKEVETQVQGEANAPKTLKGEFQELKECSQQPNLNSYYRFIEGGRVIPQKFASPSSLSLRRREK